MARMYSRKKGKHSSKHPPIMIIPRWVKMKKPEIEKLVVDLAKERKNSAAIGQFLRDAYGIPDVKILVGKSIVQIMKENKAYPALPEDLMSCLKKAVILREHMGRHKGDKLSQKGLENLESKIRRLGKYYSREGIIPSGWKYDPQQAKLIVQK